MPGRKAPVKVPKSLPDEVVTSRRNSSGFASMDLITGLRRYCPVHHSRAELALRVCDLEARPIGDQVSAREAALSEGLFVRESSTIENQSMREAHRQMIQGIAHLAGQPESSLQDAQEIEHSKLQRNRQLIDLVVTVRVQEQGDGLIAEKLQQVIAIVPGELLPQGVLRALGRDAKNLPEVPRNSVRKPVAGCNPIGSRSEIELPMLSSHPCLRRAGNIHVHTKNILLPTENVSCFPSGPKRFQRLSRIEVTSAAGFDALALIGGLRCGAIQINSALRRRATRYITAPFGQVENLAAECLPSIRKAMLFWNNKKRRIQMIFHGSFSAPGRTSCH